MWRSVSYMARIEGVTRTTILRWIKAGKYEKTKQTFGGHHRVWLEIEPTFYLYARVSSSKQQTSIEKQVELLKKEYPDGQVITDIASGFNFERRGIKTILERSLAGNPCVIVATTQDRIARTGFSLIKHLVELSGGEIRLLEEDVSTEQFDTKTLVAFITSFVNSYYGKRSAQRNGNHIEENSDISQE